LGGRRDVDLDVAAAAEAAARRRDGDVARAVDAVESFPGVRLDRRLVRAWIDCPLVPIVVWTVSTPSTARSCRSTLRAASDCTSRLEPGARSCVTVKVFCPESPR